GASSVATLLRALGADVALAGVLGDDADGLRVRQMLTDLGVGQEAVLGVAGRPTTLKERYIGRAQQKHPQQILRVDYECRDAVAALRAAEQLCGTLGLEAAVVTLDKDGMALAGRDGARGLFPTRPRQVYDITGAGDMVLSVLGLALASGASYEDAIRLANVAGG